MSDESERDKVSSTDKLLALLHEKLHGAVDEEGNIKVPHLLMEQIIDELEGLVDACEELRTNE